MPFTQSPQASRLVQLFQDHMQRYAYEPVELPVIEAADLFLVKAGDQIIHRLFTFERHGQHFALRPEFTAPAAYRYITSFGAQQPVARWQFSGAVFDDNPNDTTRDYQRLSAGAELIGLPGEVADAEIVAMAALGLARAGVTGWQITIGHVELVRRVLARFDLDSRTERFVLHHLPLLREKGAAFVLDQAGALLGRPGGASDDSSQPVLDVLLGTAAREVTLGGRSHHDIARRLDQKRQRAAERGQIAAALQTLEQWSQVRGAVGESFRQMAHLLAGDDTGLAALARWRTVIELLEVYGIAHERVLIQPDLARSWDYYTGLVFELNAGGAHLGGGGRYDELMRLLGTGRDVPAVGFAYYVDSILSLVPAAAPHLPLVIVTTPENARAAALWAAALRERGYTVGLLPPEQAASSRYRLTIDAAAALAWNNQSYQLDDISRLAADLG